MRRSARSVSSLSSRRTRRSRMRRYADAGSVRSSNSRRSLGSTHSRPFGSSLQSSTTSRHSWSPSKSTVRSRVRIRRKAPTPKLPQGVELTPSGKWVIDRATTIGMGSEGSVHPCVEIENLSKLVDSTQWTHVCKISTRVISRHSASTAVRKLDHPGIVRVHHEETSQSDTLMFSIMHRYQFDAYELVEQYGAVPESSLRIIVRRILEVLDTIHEANIAHRDLKHENILISLSQDMRIQDVGVTDFGLSVEGFDGKPPRVRGLCGSTDFLPPEAFRREGNSGRYKPYNADKCDIWAVGVLMCFLLSGCGVGIEIKEKRVAYPSLSCSEECWDVMKSIFTWNPSSRPSAKQLLKLPWFLKNKKTKQLHSAASSQSLKKLRSSRRIILTEEADFDLSKTRQLQRINSASTTQSSGKSSSSPASHSTYYDLKTPTTLAVRKARRRLRKSGFFEKLQITVKDCLLSAWSKTLETAASVANRSTG